MVNRRGFLGRILAAGTAPVLAGFIDDETTGLVVPDRAIETARDIPPDPVVIGASLSSIHNIHTGQTFGEINHVRLHNGDGTVVLLVNGEVWAIPAFRVPPGHPIGRPEIKTL
jgi:hypothetical protein